MPKLPSRKSQSRDAAEAGRSAKREKSAKGLPIEPVQQKHDDEAFDGEDDTSMHGPLDHGGYVVLVSVYLTF